MRIIEYAKNSIVIPRWFSDNAGDSCQCRRQETWVQEDPLGEERATHSSILAWRIHEQMSLVDYST